MNKDAVKPNREQQQVIDTIDGPVLVVAGAGTGKTATIVKRIEHIISDGYARPWQVLAITFTNKAAGELKERLINTVGEEANDIWAHTFHSMCGRILRRFADRLGYTQHFTIYDTDDQKRVMKRVQKSLGIEDKFLNHRAILNEISHAKDSLIDCREYKASTVNDFRKAKIAQCYEEYQNELKRADAMDFDDMIFNTVQLLKQNEDVLELYQNQFKYVIVDEYQDTSYAQYILTYLLADGYHNICVVGDDDQSIYRFRGATIENIMRFKERYEKEGVKVIQLQLAENYRSMQNILDAANAVIKNNKTRLADKRLRSYAGKEGEKIVLYTADSEMGEAQFIIDEINENVKNGKRYKDHAVLYRMNAQSRNIEIMLAKSGISYKIIGGNRFFDRKEIKDIVSYFAVINNPADNVRLQRIINTPKRGIGDTMFNYILEIAAVNKMTAFEVCEQADEFAKTSRSAGKLKAFTAMIRHFQACLEEGMSPNDLLQEILDETKYFDFIDEEDEPAKAEDRKNNVQELSSMLIKYQEEDPEFDLTDFLEDVALVSDIDSYNEDDDAVVLMTLHAAKGLEFPIVFIPGLEEGIFPGNQSLYSDEDLEEERRLAYVGITRAREKLYLVNARQRMLYGRTDRNMPSRFLREIPSNITEDKTVSKVSRTYDFGGGYSTNKGYSSGFGSPSKPHKYSKSTPIGSAHQSSSAAHQFGQVQPKMQASDVAYSVGDTVRHKAFGTGVILSQTPMGNDTLLEVAFDRAGTKKLMAKFAKLEKI
ncbi:MAG TPA: ATP-dependent DNA helicase PcrA [Ruminococcaceae bacterium]|nr:ATP-dependent DNA helicase PcrA [Oscillospiraceae bacterium]HCO37867.1 ATP-dependent DNA helicase PcrA [Oscillospiraceae bacterium]